MISNVSCRNKEKIAAGILAVWAVIFCLSFCDELGVWVNVGKVADHAVEEILAAPSIKIAPDIQLKSIQSIGFVCSLLVTVAISSGTDFHRQIVSISYGKQFGLSPPIFQKFSRILI